MGRGDRPCSSLMCRYEPPASVGILPLLDTVCRGTQMWIWVRGVHLDLSNDDRVEEDDPSCV